jgi:hypothetical protein
MLWNVNRLITRAAAIAVLAACLSGCADRPATVEGTVTLDGQPVADAQVTLVLDGADGPAPSAETDADGKFRLEAMPGKYKVTVFKRVIGPQPMKSALPQKYAQHSTTPFSCTVPVSEPLALRLTSASR